MIELYIMENSFSNNPLISVVVPVYCHTADHAQFLKETLESVAGQSYRNFEVILVDDRSPIDITPIVTSITSLPRTKIITNAANMGHAESRNVGIRAAEGDLIAFLDHDDLWLPEKLASQVNCFADNPQAGLVFCDMEIFGAQANRLNIDQSLIPEKPSFYWFVCHGNFTISASAVLVKKNVMQEIGFFDSRYSTCDDFDAWLKVLMLYEIIHIPLELAKISSAQL